ncbi:MAG TPA: hypothetical protein VGL61_23385 [Kofleriaceae bacterium]|jgi:hypothetical protein
MIPPSWIGIAAMCFASSLSAPSFAGERTGDPAPATATPDPVIVAPPQPASRAQSSNLAATQPETPAASSQSSVLSAEPVDTGFHIDAMLGFESDNLSLGIGVRGGKTFANHIYVGGLFVYQIGTSSSAAVEGVTASSSVSAFYIGPEVGYDLHFAALPVVFRPYLGLGVADAIGSSTVNGMTTSASSSELSVWPGVTGLYRIPGSSFVVGGDFRIVTGPWGTAVGLFATGSMYL